ncbi:MAG: hypothetical protein RPR40_07365 [Bermanella sp.]
MSDLKTVVVVSNFRCKGKLAQKGDWLAVGEDISKSDAKAVVASGVARAVKKDEKKPGKKKDSE